MGIKRPNILHRQDLVAQFESCVKQEIAEHNKHMNRCNENISNFRKDIRQTERDMEDRLKLFEMYVSEVRRRIDGLGSLEDRLKVLEQRSCDDISKRNNRIEERLKRLEEKHNDSVNQIDLDRVHNRLYNEILGLINRVDHLREGLSADIYENEISIGDLDLHLRSLDEQIKMIYHDSSDRLDIAEKEINKRCMEIDNFEKRIKDMQKQQFINEKKIEYLINQLNRMKKPSV